MKFRSGFGVKSLTPCKNLMLRNFLLDEYILCVLVSNGEPFYVVRVMQCAEAAALVRLSYEIFI